MRGSQHIDEASQSDPVLVRADGSYLYSFTSVVDDVAFGITHVIRGEDHVTNSGAQIQMFARPRRDAAGLCAFTAAGRCERWRFEQAHRLAFRR